MGSLYTFQQFIDPSLKNIKLSINKRDVLKFYFMRNIYQDMKWFFKDQTNLIALLRTKITQLSTRCTDLYKANLNLEEINQAHKKLNGELRVEVQKDEKNNRI